MPYPNTMKLVKTITTKVWKPTSRKRGALDGLRRSWKDALASKL